jgi:hypothetical protein
VVLSSRLGGRQVDFPWSKENPDAHFVLDDDADSFIALYRGLAPHAGHAGALREQYDDTVGD